MEFIIVFILTVILSGIGSLQLGLVNSEVICTAFDNKRKAKYVALGGVLPELLYAFLALSLFDLLIDVSNLYRGIFIILSNSLVVIIGLSFFIRSVSDISRERIEMKRSKRKIIRDLFSDRSGAFVKGFILGLVNFQLIVFWFLSSLYIDMYLPFDMNKYAFILGAPTGALVVLLLFIKLVSNFKDRYFQKINTKLIFKITGLTLISIAIYQTIKYFLI